MILGIICMFWFIKVTKVQLFLGCSSHRSLYARNLYEMYVLV